MNVRPFGILIAAAACAASLCGQASAAAFDRGNVLGSSYSPRVPVSALAKPMSWFDASRLHVSTSVSVGSSFGGGANALQVTSFSYKFGAPMWMNVNVGNSWGPSRAGGNSAFFLEGLDFGFRPSANMVFQVTFRDVRSPLQLPYGYRNGLGYGSAYGNGYGFADPSVFGPSIP
jgi:hypothetical protein